MPRLPAGLGLALVGLLLAAVFLGSLPDDRLWQRVVEDSGHGPVFACLALALLWMQSPPAGQSVRSLSQYRNVLALALALSVATELLQWFMPSRNVSAGDVLHDAAGTMLGLALAWVIERRRARRLPSGRAASRTGSSKDALAGSVALAAFVLLAWQPLQCARAYAERAAAWPALLPLGGKGDAAFMTVHSASGSNARLPAPYARAGDGDSLRLAFQAGARPGVQLIEPVPDWREHDTLVIDLTNPAPRAVALGLRILDRRHDYAHDYEDRFNQRLTIPASARVSVRIALAAVEAGPSRRRLDMAAIADVLLFARQPLDAGELYLTRVWLE